jgi:hypothetical protein
VARALLPAKEPVTKGNVPFGITSLWASFLELTILDNIVMSKAAAKPKSAMDELGGYFSDLVEDARERMSPEEFQKAEKEFDEIINKAKARASRGGQRETA